MKFPFESLFKDLLVIDIETASEKESYDELDPRLQSLWDKKATFLQKSEELTPEELYFTRGAIFAEFGKIICISAGVFTREESNETGMRIKSFASDDESEILTSFKQLIESKFNEKSLRLVAHNGKEFDFPYLCRRMLVHDISIPEALDIRDKKPWDIRHIDTMELWKFGDRKNFTSLDLLAALFRIGSSKDDIDGSQVNEVYYNDKNLERISTYCQKDVLVTAQVLLRLNGLPTMEEENIKYL